MVGWAKVGSAKVGCVGGCGTWVGRRAGGSWVGPPWVVSPGVIVASGIGGRISWWVGPVRARLRPLACWDHPNAMFDRCGRVKAVLAAWRFWRATTRICACFQMSLRPVQLLKRFIGALRGLGSPWMFIGSGPCCVLLAACPQGGAQDITHIVREPPLTWTYLVHLARVGLQWA